MKTILLTILINLIPSISVFIGRHDGVFHKLIEKGLLKTDFDILETQLWCFGLGIIWVGLIGPIQFAVLKNKMREKESIFRELIAYNKNSLLKLAKEEIGKRNVILNTRVFKLQGGFRGLWNRFWRGKRLLVPIDVIGITDMLHAADISFNIKGSIEGMVGKSFVEQVIVVDYDLSNNNTYNLTTKQRTQVSHAKFCTTIPLFDSNDNVKAILSIDCDQQLDLTDEKKKVWNDHIIYYAAFVNKHIKL